MKVAKDIGAPVFVDRLDIVSNYILVEDDYDFGANNKEDVTSVATLRAFFSVGRINFSLFRQSLKTNIAPIFNTLLLEEQQELLFNRVRPDGFTDSDVINIIGQEGFDYTIRTISDTEKIEVLEEVVNNIDIDIQNDLSGKLDKTGGTITGTLTLDSVAVYSSDLRALYGDRSLIDKKFFEDGLSTKANQSDLNLQGVTSNGSVTNIPITLNSGFENGESFFRVRGSVTSHLFEVRNLENDEKVIITSQNSTSIQRDTIKIVDFSAVGTGIGFGDDRSPTSTYVSINTTYTAAEDVLNFEWNGNGTWYKWLELTGNYNTNNQDDMRINILSQVNSSAAINIDAHLRVTNNTNNVLYVNSIDGVVYINSNDLAGILPGDNLDLYAGGRIALGDSATINRLRANSPGNVPRALSLIDTNAVIRVWRFTDAAVDPAVEFIWGNGETPTSTGNAWWDMYLDGAAPPNDAFAIRRRSDGNVEKFRLTTNTAAIPMTTVSTSPTTGALVVSGGVGIAGATNLAGLAKYSTNLSASYDNRTLVDREFVETLPLTVSNVVSAGATSTTSTAYTLQTGMILTNVPAGTYLVGYGNWLSHNSTNAEITTQIYVGGAIQTGSEMLWRRGGNQGNTNGLITYNNFQITLASTQTVEIRWRTNTGTATSNNRYLTLLKVSSIR